MVNRAAVLLKFKKPFVNRVNESDPYKKSSAFTLEEANEERQPDRIHIALFMYGFTKLATWEQNHSGRSAYRCTD